MKQILIKIFIGYIRFKNEFIPRFFVFSTFASSLYYLFFSKKFKREHYAVLKGKLKHIDERKKSKNNIYTLIRNVHRIEKGLIMKNRRSVFGLDFISETIDAFIEIWKPEKTLNSVQFQWFYDVLDEYFNVTGEHELLDNQRDRFRKFTKEYDKKTVEKFSDESRTPFARDVNNLTDISYEQFYHLTKQRRSVRWFKDQKVPHDLVDKAILAANQSPSACNRQPFHFRVFDETNKLKEVANLPMGVKGYVDGIPMMVVVTGNLDAYFDERDRHIIYIDGSLASMSFMFALETLGLSSCAINWPDIEQLEVKMEKALQLKKHERVVMCIAVGFPDFKEKVPYSGKKDLDNIRTYN